MARPASSSVCRDPRIDGIQDGVGDAVLGDEAEQVAGLVHREHRGPPDVLDRLVGRFGARSKARKGEPTKVAVDTRALHFFDPETGLGIYDGTKGDA